MEAHPTIGTPRAASELEPRLSLFGDATAVGELRRLVAHLVEAKRGEEWLRIWIPSCGGGELAYAVAALVSEEIDRSGARLSLRIFATDDDLGALRRARLAWYPAGLADVLAALDLDAHFVRDEGGYHATSALRDTCIFAAHDLTRDPPLHRLDIVVCGDIGAAQGPERDRELRQKFGFGLRPRGLLIVDPKIVVGDAAHFVPEVVELGMYRISGSAAREASAIVDSGHRASPIAAALHADELDCSALERLWRTIEAAEETNEQLVCTNEELQCSQEEVRSVNVDLERANAELVRRVAELEAVRNDLDNVLRGARIPTLFLDLRGRIKWFSPATTEVLRVREADIGRSLAEIRAHVTGADLGDEAAAVIREGTAREVAVTRGSGHSATYFRVRLLPYRGREAGIEGVVVCFVDVTDLECTTRALERQAAQQRSIAELGVLALESTVEELFARAVESMHATLGAGRCQIRELEAMTEMLLRESGITSGASPSIRDDTLVYELLRAYAGADHADSGLGSDELAYLRSLSSLLGSALSRHHALAELREQVSHKDDFLAMLGHELRNPLAAIATANELQRSIPTEDPILQKAATVIGRQVGQVVRIIDDLLDVSRFARGKITLERELLDLGRLVRRVVDDHAALARSGLELELVMSAQPIVVLGDRERLVQVLNNLLSNAVQFTAPPGTVTVSLSTTGDDAELRITDTGCGIEPEFFTHLFEPFRQAPQSLARQGGGLGLGLALVERIVVQLGGRVFAESKGPGRGATFVVRLPASATLRVQDPPVAAARCDALRILLVEDNEDAAEVLATMLARVGHAVRIAHNAGEGLQAARGGEHDVLLCDIGLPGELDGYDFARCVREDAEVRPAALISISGYGRPEDIERAQRAGFDLHLTKPVDVASLERAIAVVVDRRRASAES